ncbi:MAG: hypothetical protein LBH43_02265 [Treponema sp.]|jgi:hypothetical protein|nr:hypothetical protein [Treponema sp.]
MADPELVRALDYILNRSDEASIEVLAEAVVRRRRDIAMLGGALNVSDPGRMAKEISGQINASIGAGMEGLKQSVREMTMRIIAQEAPELSDEQIAALTRSMIPDSSAGEAESSKIPRDLLASMIDQFASFSRGNMSKLEDKHLRDEMGSWPERYWKAFPPVIRSLITDFLKDRISEKEFNSKIGIALEV